MKFLVEIAHKCKTGLKDCTCECSLNLLPGRRDSFDNCEIYFSTKKFELKQNLDMNTDENVSEFCIFTAATKNVFNFLLKTFDTSFKDMKSITEL